MSQNDVDAIERMLGGKPASAPKPGKRPPRQYAAEVKDDSGVNDPNAKKQPSRRIFWPFPLMAKNQFFEVTNPQHFQKARVAASAYGTRNAKRFSCVVDDNTGHLIVRRIE